MSQCFKSRAELKAAYRFFDNDFVTPEKILSPHYESTLARIKAQPTVILPNDTSSIDFSSKTSVEGLGILGSSFSKGLFLHPTLAVTPDRICLGVVDMQVWARGGEAKRRSLPAQQRMNEPIEQKESFRWILSYRRGCELARLVPETQFVVTDDRESDILELLVEAVQEKEKGGADLLVRANHDRILIIEDKKEERKLREKVRNAPIIGQTVFKMPTRSKKPERVVTQTLRACSVHLKGKKVGDREYPSIKINVVFTEEINPLPGEEPVSWLLFTTLPIETIEQVLKIIQYYLSRWDIEVFFKVLKSGCKVEDRELKSADSLTKIMALFMIVAWRVLYTMTMGRKQPHIPCTEFFEEVEWQAVYKVLNRGSKLPKKPPTIGEFMLMVASLGGYIEGKKRPPPGPTMIWRGLNRVYDFALAWEIYQGSSI